MVRVRPRLRLKLRLRLGLWLRLRLRLRLWLRLRLRVRLSVIVFTQVARYVASFTWALCGEGVFLFLCLDSAGIESLHTAVRLAAAWACALVGGCS